MAESESDALPLGDTPIFFRHDRDNIRYYITAKTECQAYFSKIFLFDEIVLYYTSNRVNFAVLFTICITISPVFDYLFRYVH